MPTLNPLNSITKADTVPDSGPPEVFIARVSIGGYHIIEEIGRGGMGVVYRAYDAELKRYVALKVLTAGPGASLDALVRFRGEAEVVAKLQHPHIVQIYDSGQHEGQQFLVLELVEGGSLDKFIAGKPQSARDAAAIVETLARAVQVAHQEGIIHRDLKPANVLRSKAGTLKITDFGLAKQLDHSLGFSRTGDLRGTPQYMAPEQAGRENGTLGPATDVYALGAILYELLTGRPPFVANNLLDILDQIIGVEATSPSQLVPRLPRDLCTICLKCLEKNSARRYPTAGALADDLRRWQDGIPILARPLSRTERCVRSLRRHPLAAGLVVSVCVAIAALTLWAFSARERSFQDAQARRDSAHRADLEQQYDRALQALDNIRDVVTNDPQLGRNKALLQTLVKHYQEMVVTQENSANRNATRLAKSAAQLAQLMDKTGNKHGALAAFQLARAMTSENSLEDRYQVAKLYLEMGRIYTDLGQRDTAEVTFLESGEILERLIGEEPTRLEFSHDVAELWHNRGLLYSSWRGKTEARDAFKQGRDIRIALNKEHTPTRTTLRDLARSHGFLGDVELDLGDVAAAAASYLASHELRQQLMTQVDKDLEAKFQFARSFRNFGNLHTQQRDYLKAITAYGEARRLQEELVRRDSATVDYQSDLANTLCRLAELSLMHDPKPGEAAQLAVRAIELSRPLHEAEPEAAVYRSTLCDALLLAAMSGLENAPHAAWPQLDDIGRLLETHKRNADDWYTLAAARALGSERPGLSTLDATAYRKQAVATLSTAVKQGFRRKHPDDLKADRAFKSVAIDDDFLRLMRDYAAGPVQVEK